MGATLMAGEVWYLDRHIYMRARGTLNQAAVDEAVRIALADASSRARAGRPVAAQDGQWITVDVVIHEPVAVKVPLPPACLPCP